MNFSRVFLFIIALALVSQVSGQFLQRENEGSEIVNRAMQKSISTSVNLTAEQIGKDKNIDLIDQQIRTVNDLPNYTIESVQYQLIQNGENYTIEYVRNKNESIMFQAQVSSIDGKIIFERIAETHNINIQPSAEKHDQTPMRVGGADKLTDEEINSDKNLQIINQKLKTENDLQGFTIESVRKQLVNGWIYTIVYVNSKGTLQTFQVYFTFDEKITVRRHNVEKGESQSMMERETMPEQNNGPVMLTAEQIASDITVQAINRKLRNDYQLSGYVIDQVMFNAPNQLYRFVYQDGIEKIETFIVTIGTDGEINVNDSTAIPKAQKPVQSNQPVNLTAEQIASDMTVQAIDRALRNDYQLSGYVIYSVQNVASRELYRVTYTNGQTVWFIVMMGTNGEINVLENTGILKAQQPVQSNQPVSLTAEQIASDPNVKAIDSVLRNDYQLQGYVIYSVLYVASRQLYRVTYTNGQTVWFIVMMGTDGAINVLENTGILKAQQPVQSNQPVSLTAEQIASDMTVQAIDRALRNDYQLSGYIIDSVMFDPGTTQYRVTYMDTNGQTVMFIVMMGTDGAINVLENTAIPKAQKPVQSNQPVNLTAEQIASDMTVQAIDRALRNDYQLSGYIIDSVMFDASYKIYRVTYTNGQTVWFIVMMGTNGEINVLENTAIPKAQQPVQSNQPVSLTAEQIASDMTVQAIDRALRNDYQLSGYIIDSVMFDASYKIYRVTYTNGQTVWFIVMMGTNGEINVLENTGILKAQQPVQSNQPVSLTAEQIASDMTVQAIDRALRNDYQLSGYIIDSVMFDPGTTQYRVTYMDTNGQTVMFIVMMGTDGAINVLENTAIPKAQKPVQSNQPVNLTAEQIASDMTVQAIDRALRNDYQLSGYIIDSVMFDASYKIYRVTYTNGQTVWFIVMMGTNGEINVLENTGILKAQQPVQSNQPVSLTAEQIASDPNVKAIDSVLRNDYQLQGYVIYSVLYVASRQLYRVTYTNGQTVWFIVMMGTDGAINVLENTGILKAQQPVQSNQPVSLTAEQIASDMTVQAIDRALRNDYQLSGYIIDSVMFDPGTTQYRVTYMDTNGQTVMFIVMMGTDGAINVLENTAIPKAQQPVQSNQPVSLTAEQIASDMTVQAIDRALRNDYQLSGYIIDSVMFDASYKIYRVTYTNGQTVWFIVMMGTNGEINVLENTGILKAQQPVQSNQPVSLTAEQIASDPNVKAIDSVLRNDYQLQGYVIYSVLYVASRQLYRVTYTNGQTVWFIVMMGTDGAINVLENTGILKAQQPVQSNQPVSLTAEQIASDMTVQAIDRALRNDYQLSGYIIDSVMFDASYKIYRVTYTNGQTVWFIVMMGTNGEINVLENTGILKAQQPVQSNQPVSLTAEQIASDPNVKAIDSVLRNDYQLQGYVIYSVLYVASRQLYRVTYTNGQTVWFIVMMGTDGAINVLENTGILKAQQPVQSNQPVSLTAEQIASDMTVQAIDRALRNDYQLSGYIIDSVMFDASYKIYRVTYTNGQTVWFIVMMGTNGEINVLENTGILKAQQPVQSNQPVSLTAEQIASDMTVQAIDSVLRNDYQLQGYVIYSVLYVASRQLYRVTYTNGQTVIFIVMMGTNGEINVLENTGILKAQQPVQSNQPVSLTAEQIASDMTVQAIDRALRNDYQLSGYIIDSVMFDASYKIYRVTYTNGQTVWFIVMMGTNGAINVKDTTAIPKGQQLVQSKQPVSLTAEQIASDPNVKAIDSVLRNDYQLSGYIIDSVLFDPITTQYIFVYYDGIEKIVTFIIKMGTDGTFNVTDSTVPKAQFTAGHLPIPKIPVIPQITVYQDQANLTLAAFNQSYMQEYQSLIALYQMIYGNNTKIVSVFVNIEQQIVRFVSQNGIVTSFEISNGQYSVKTIQIVDELGSKFFQYNVPEQNFQQFVESLNLSINLPSSAILSISGYYQEQNLSALTIYSLEILLIDGHELSIKYIEITQQQKMVLTFINNSMSHLIFKEPIQQSMELSMYGFQANPNHPMFVQQSSQNPEIIRIVFMPQGANHRVELIVNHQEHQIFKVHVLNQGFVELHNLQQNESDSISQTYSIVDEYNRQRFPSFAHASIKLIMIREIGNVYSFDIVYETMSSAYRIKTNVLNKVPTIYSYQPIYQKLKPADYKYPYINQETAVDFDDVQQMRRYKMTEKNLFRMYGHFFHQPTLMKLFVSESPEKYIYKAFYQSRQSIFHAVTEYYSGSSQVRVTTLVMLGNSQMQLQIKNCVTMSIQKDQCVRCESGYEIARNGLCYKAVDNCQTSSAATCLICRPAYTLNKAKNACGMN